MEILSKNKTIYEKRRDRNEGSYTFQGMALGNAHKSMVPKKHNEITKKILKKCFVC